MRVHKIYMRAAQRKHLGALHQNEWKMSGTSRKIISMKWRGMYRCQVHEKERESRRCLHPRHMLTVPALTRSYLPIPTSLFLSRQQWISCSQFDVKMLFLCLMHSQQTNKILKQNKDVGMGKYERMSAGTVSNNVGMGLWMSLCLGVGIFLFPSFFMHWHPYIPLHFIEMIFPLVYIPPYRMWREFSCTL